MLLPLSVATLRGEAGDGPARILVMSVPVVGIVASRNACHGGLSLLGLEPFPVSSPEGHPLPNLLAPSRRFPDGGYIVVNLELPRSRAWCAHRTIRPVASPPVSRKTSPALTRLKSPWIECFRQDVPTAKLSAS